MRDNVTNLRLHFAVIGLASCTACAGPVRAEPDVTVNQVTSMWKTRQAKFHTVKYAWTERDTLPKGSIQKPNAPLRPGFEGLTIPPEDITYDVPYQLALDGDKMRYSYEGKAWSVEKKSLLPDPYISVFDGSVSKIFHPSGYTQWPVGIIRPEKRNVDSRNYHVKSLLLAFRPLPTTTGSFSPSDFTISKERALLQNKECIVLQQPLRAGVTSQTLWLDPSRNLVVLRYMESRSGKVGLKLDIQYTNDPDSGWIPASWECLASNPNGSLQEAFAATVTTYKINGPISPDEFQIDFPPGTRVRDQRPNATVPEYIVRKDGSKRSLPSEDIGASYEQLVSSEPGQAHAYPVSVAGRHRWLTPTLVALAVLTIFAVWTWRKRATAK